MIIYVLSVFRRPYCDDFLNFCALNFELGVWSSRKKYNLFSSFPILAFLFCSAWYLLSHSNFCRENVASVVNIVMRDFKPHLLFCWVGQLNTCLFSFFVLLCLLFNMFRASICAGHVQMHIYWTQNTGEQAQTINAEGTEETVE